MASYTWEVDSNKKLVLKDGQTTVAEITGLNSSLVQSVGSINATALANYIDFTAAKVDNSGGSATVTEAGTITLKTKALGSSAISLSAAAGYSGYYTLALDGATSITGGSYVLGGETIAAYWGVTAGTAGKDDVSVKTATYYDTGTKEKWTLNTGGLSIDYTAQANGTSLAYITGLKGSLDGKLDTDLTPTGNLNTDSNIIALDTASIEGSASTMTTFTLSIKALNGTNNASDGNQIILTDIASSDNKLFTLALGEGIAIFDSASSTSNPRIGSVSDGTATILRDQSAGWKTIVAGTSFSYSKADTKTLATITNLNTSVSAGTGANAGKFGTTDATTKVFTEALTINGTEVTLKNNALSTGTISIADDVNIGNDSFSSFKLALDSSDSTYNSTNKTLGFEDIESTWSLSGTSASYKSSGKTEGWTLSGTSVVTYTAASSISSLATITNLSTAVRELNGKIGTYTVANNGTSTFNEGITVTTNDSGSNIFTLAKAVLTTTSGIASATTLKDDNDSDGIDFLLALKNGDGINDPDAEPTSFSLGSLSVVSGSASLTIIGTKNAGWTLSGTSITYTGVINESLATITNLSSAVISQTDNGVTTFGTSVAGKFVEGITLNDKVVTINEAALTHTAGESNATTLTPTAIGSNYAGISFSLAKGTDAEDPGDKPIDIRLGGLSYASESAVRSLNVIGTMTQGWTLSGTSKITFTAEDSNRVLAEITNLNKDVVKKDFKTGTGANEVTVEKFGTNVGNKFVEGITLDGTTITLKQAVLNALEDVKTANGGISTNNSTTITQASGNTFGNDYTYSFALDADVKAPAADSHDIKGIRLGNLSSVSGGTSKSLDIFGTLSAGWNLGSYSDVSNTKVTYTAQTDQILATISGLSNNLVAGTGSYAGKFGLSTGSTFTEALSLADKTVTLYSIALRAGNVTLASNSTATNYDTDYNLDLGNDVVKNGQKIVASSVKVSNVEDGTATIQAKKDKFWTLNNDAKGVTYTGASTTFEDVATVTGLNKNIITAGTSFFLPATTAGGDSKQVSLSVAANANNGNIEFKLVEGSLSDSDVTIAPIQVAGNTTKEKFTLAFANGSDTGKLTKYNIGYNFGAASGTVGFEPIYYWDKNATNTTAYLKADRAEGWTLGADATKVTYTKKAETAQIVATIKNLQKSLVAEDLETADWNEKGSIRNKIAGISLSDTNTGDNYRFDTITLDKGVLTTTAGTAGATTLTLGKELGSSSAAKYTLALQTTADDGKVPTTSATGQSGFTQLGSTATYNELTGTEFWTINTEKNTVTYTAQKAGDLLFTLKGLNSKVTADDIVVTEGNGTDPGTIKLKAGALNNANVTLVNGKGNYTLTLFHSDALADTEDSVPLSTVSNAKWSLNTAGTIATYKGDVATGYEISLDGKTVIYTTGATNKTIATVSNLKGGLTVSDDGSYIGVKDENDNISQGLTLADKANTNNTDNANLGIHKNVITLTSDVLGTTNVSLTGTGIGANYTLDLDTTTEGVKVPSTADVTTTNVNEAKYDTGTAPAAIDVWRVSGSTSTTATYKNVVPLYYTLNAGDRGVTYHAEETKKTYATVTGLKKGLVVGEKTESGALTTWVGVKDEETGTIGEAVKIKNSTATNGDKLVIVLDDDAFAATTIKVSNGGTDKYTFELTEDAKALAPARDNDAALTFSQTQDNSTKTTTGYLKGTLTAGYTLSDDKAAVTYSTKNTNYTFATITGLKQGLSSSDFNGSNAGIRIKSDDEKKKIELDLKMLGTTDVKLDATAAADGYTLVGKEGEVFNATDAAKDEHLKNVWAVNASSNTTYNYNTIIPASYTPGSQKVGNANKENTVLTYKGESVKTTLATITNLKSGLKISDDRSTLAGVKIGSVNSSGTFTENGTYDTKAIQLSKDVLVTGASKPVGITGSSYKLTITDDVKTTKKAQYWTVSGTSAARKYDTTAGFVVTTGTTVSTDGTGTTVTYQAPKSATVVATITGLKSGLSPKSDGSIDGIKFGEMETKDNKSVFVEKAGGKVIQLSESVLDNKTVELVVPTGTTGYTLALENYDNLKPKTGQYAFEVDSKDGTVTLKTGYNTAGYTDTNGTSTKFTYAAGSGGTAVAKISGLKSGLKADDGAIEGIEIGHFVDNPDKVDESGDHPKMFAEDTSTTSNGTSGNPPIIRLSAGVLNAKDVTIKPATGTGDSSYHLAIKTEKDSDTDSASTLVAEPVYTKAWKVPSKGKATFTETTSAGYTLDKTTEGATSATTILYSDKKVVTTTLTGLNDSIKLIELDATNEDGLNPDGTKVKVAGIDKNNYVKFTEIDPPSSTPSPDTEEEVEMNYGTFTLGEKVLKKGNVTLTNDEKGAYTLELASGVAAQNYNDTPEWFKEKNSDTATYSIKTRPGYTVASNGLKVNYSTKDTYTNYAKVTGLNKDIEAENGAIDGISFGVVKEENVGTTAKPVYAYTKQILLGYNALTSSDVTVETENGENVVTSDIKGTPANNNLDGYKAEYILAFKEDGETNAAADADNNTDTNKKWYNSLYAAPTWSFKKKQGTATLTGGMTGSWAIKTTTTGTGSSAKTTSDPKTIVYTAGTTETLATVSGVNVVTKDGVNTVEGLALYTWNRTTTGSGSTKTEKGEGVIQLTLDSLNNKDVTVEVPDTLKKNYTFTFETEGSIAEPAKQDEVWVTDGKGNATYQYTVTEGYTLDSDKKTTLTYSAENTTTLAKLTGLNSAKVTKTDAAGVASIEGIEVTQSHTDAVVDDKGKETTAAVKGLITLTDDSILGKTVKITGDKYSLGLADNVATQIKGKQWYLSGTTATYKEYYSTGYNLNDAKTTATKATTEAAGDTILTIKGLKKNLKVADVSAGITVSDDYTVAIKDSVLGTTKVTLENGTYKDYNDKDVKYEYQFDDDGGFTKPVKETPKWGFSKGVANLMQNTTKGFTLESSDSTKELNDVLTYSGAKNVSLAKVKGLNTALKVFNDAKITDTETGETDTKNVIGTYKTEKVNGKNTTVLDTVAITFDENNQIIALGEKAFNKKEVSISGDGGYKLAFGTMGSTNTAEDQVTKWVVSGTTGTFKQYKPLYYTLNDKQDTISYTKEESPKESIFAKVTNLKSNTELTSVQFNGSETTNPNYAVNSKNEGDIGGVLTLYANNLNKKNLVLSGNAGYALALGDDVSKSTVQATSSAAANSAGKAVLTGTRKAGYELAFGSKSVTYVSKDKTNQAVATVTGLKKEARISADEGVITLSGSQLNKKTVTLTSNLGTTDYTLAVSEDATLKAPTVTLRTKDDGSDNYWNLKGSTASIMGAVTEDGYILSESKKSLTYIKETAKYSKPNKETGVINHKVVSIATIKGMKSTDSSSVDAETQKISLHGNNLDRKVTVNGGAFSVDIDSNFNNSSLTGSSAADRITVSGTGLTITGGAGDDAIDLGSGGNNTFVYANGAGNDVITGFTPGVDRFVVTKGTITVEHDGDDAIVKVGAGKVRLKGAYAVLDDKKTLTIYSKTSDTTGKDYFIPATPTMTNYNNALASNTLLEDSNYSADAAQLSEIVQPAAATYTPYDFDSGLSLTKEDKLTAAAVTYSGDSNKK